MVEKNQVLKAAKNARINVTDREAEQFTEEFEHILEKFEELEKVETDNIEPSFHPTDVKPITREDQHEESISKKEVFQNTENEKDGKFKGPSA